MPSSIGLSHWVTVLLLAAMLAGCGGRTVRTTTQADISVGSTTRTELPESLADESIPPAQQDQRRSIIDTAYAMRGQPYRWGGRSPRRGFDCSGLVYFAHQEAGISVPRMSRNQLSQSVRVAIDRIQPGDLLFFKIATNLSHVGIYIGERNFIHAPSRGKRVSISSLENVYWRGRLYAAGHFYSQ